MDDLKNLKDRLGAAVDRIAAGMPDQDPGVSTLAAENAALLERLNHIQAQREADRRELDTLIDQIRPLIEGEQNA